MINKVGKDIWAIEVRHYDPLKKYGSRRRLSKFVGSKKEAEQKEKELLEELANSSTCSTGSLTSCNKSIETFDSAVTSYISYSKTKGICESYEEFLYFLHRELGEFPLDTTLFVKYFRKWLDSRNCSLTRKNRYITVVKAVWNYLLELGDVERNPITKVLFPKAKEFPRDRRLTDEERDRLFETILEYRPEIYFFIKYQYYVPCRAGELVRAKRRDYDHKEKVLFVPKSKNGKPIFKPIPPVSDLQDYFANLPIDAPLVFFKKSAKGYESLKNYRFAWEYCLKKADIPDYRCHDLRHEAVTNMYKAGNSIREIMDVAGWSTDMLSRYRHINSFETAQNVKWSVT